MTKLYFIRHAESDISVHDDLLRPLTPKGELSSKLVTRFLQDKNIVKIYSSPYKRTIDTIKDFSVSSGLEVEIIEDLRERKVSDKWIGVDNFDDFAKKQWGDFNYKLEQGESLVEVQERNIRALEKILNDGEGNIVVGTHGTALSTILNYYNNEFCYQDFERIRPQMPYIVCLQFKDGELVNTEEFII